MDSHTLIQALIYLGFGSADCTHCGTSWSGIGTWLPDRRLHYWPVGLRLVTDANLFCTLPRLAWC